MTSTTGTTIESYISWLTKEVENKNYGEVSISLTICRGQVVKVTKGSIDTEKIDLKKVDK